MGWKDKVAKSVWGAIKSKTTPDKSKLDLAKSELNIATAKGKSIDKMAKDVKGNVEMFKQSKAFKEGLGKFGFNKPKGK